MQVITHGHCLATVKTSESDLLHHSGLADRDSDRLTVTASAAAVTVISKLGFTYHDGGTRMTVV